MKMKQAPGPDKGRIRAGMSKGYAEQMEPNPAGSDI